MRQLLAAIFAILFASVVLKFGNSLLSLTVNLTLNEAGERKEIIGLVGTAFSFGYFFGGINARRLIGALGHVRALTLTTALAGIVTLLFPIFPGAFAWVALRAAYGFSSAVAYIVFESWLNARADSDTRGRVLGLYASSNYFAVFAGQLLINLGDVGGSLAFSLSAIFLLLGVIPVVVTKQPQPSIEETQRLSLRELYRQTPLAVVVVTGGGLLTGGMFGLGAVFAQDIGLSLLQISLFAGAPVLGAFLLLWLIGRFSDHFGRRAAMAWALGVVVALASVLAASGELGLGFPYLLAIMVVLGAHMLSIYHSGVSHAYDRLPKEHYVAASGSFQVCFSTGSMLGPLLTGAAMQHLGPHWLWAYAAAVALLLLIFVAYRWVRRPAVVREQQAPQIETPTL